MTEQISKNWKKLAAIVAGVGLFGMMVGNFIPTASAGIIIQQEPCDSGDGIITHWDKIIFSSPSSIKKPDLSIIPKNEMLDVRVATFNPSGVTDLRQEVVDSLNNQGFTRPNDDPMAKHLITIIDVEYAISCFHPGLPQA